MMGFFERHTDKVGIFGTAFAALCCLGFPALISLLSAVGLGFLINDSVLFPILGVSLIISVVGLSLGIRHHHQTWALLLGAISAATTYVFIAVSFHRSLAITGIIGLVFASLLNIWLKARQLKSSRSKTRSQD